MKILRIGGLNFASSRFIDVLLRSDVEKLAIIDFSHHKLFANEVIETINFFGLQELLKKLELHFIEFNVLGKIWERFLQYKFLSLPRFSYKVLYRELIDKLSQYSNDWLIWIGDNDFDGSNFLFKVVHDFFNNENIIRSYKETRYRYNALEKYMLEKSKVLIFPHQGYMDFFKNLYPDLKLPNILYGDLDWRFSKHINWVKSLETKKLSETDGKIHVCILAGRAISDPNEEKRSGWRYYYIPIIKELIKRNIHVHLHTLKIIPSKKHGNLYEKLSNSNSNFTIEKPLKLIPGSNDYKILKRYDAGILHFNVPKESKELFEFQKINIPNRIYEYQMADVVPILERNSLPATEKIIKETEFGIIYEDYEELAYKLNELITGRRKTKLERNKIKDFSNFADLLLEASHLK